jgi:hypothetical protein
VAEPRQKCCRHQTEPYTSANRNIEAKEKEVIMAEFLSKEVFIPIKIDSKVGRRANIIKPNDYYANTNLARLLAKARILESKLINEPETSLCQFCKMHNISPRYLRSIISLNNLSPRIKTAIMEGYTPRHLSVQDITNHKFPLIWMEQEEWFFLKIQ